MAFVHGKTAVLSIDTAPGGSLGNVSTYLESIDFSRDIDTAETTTLGDDDKTYLVGMRGATMSVSGIWDATIDGYIDSYAGSVSTGTFQYSPDGGTTVYSGEMRLTSYAVSTGTGDKATFSADFQITGAVSRS